MPVRILTVRFAAQLQQHELTAFRGALAAKAGLENDLFHNHNNDETAANAYHYRYPLVQYSLQSGQPTLVCINEGIEEMQAFFAQPDWTLNLHGQPLPLTIADLHLSEHTLSIAETPRYTYTIQNWQALNQKNYAEYQKLTGLAEKTMFLEKKLVGCIIAFAKGMDWFIDTPILVKIEDFYTHSSRYKHSTPVLTYDLRFQTNIKIPTHIGIGKGAALGFGRVFKGHKK